MTTPVPEYLLMSMIGSNVYIIIMYHLIKYYYNDIILFIKCYIFKSKTYDFCISYNLNLHDNLSDISKTNNIAVMNYRYIKLSPVFCYINEYIIENNLYDKITYLNNYSFGVVYKYKTIYLNDIKISINSSCISCNDEKHRITINFKFYNLNDMKKIKNYCEELYNKNKTNDHNPILVYNYDEVIKMSQDKDIKTKYYKKLDTLKYSIDNTYYKEKQFLLDTLDFYLNNKSHYTDNNINYNLGILLYGEPGTGKSSIIKSLIKYINYDTIFINTNTLDLNTFNILTRQEYGIELINNDNDNKKYIDLEKRVYIIEDIDCSNWSNIVKDRNKIQSNNNDNGNINFSTFGNKNESITLNDILQFLDGIDNVPKIFIISTNHIDTLDPAFIRPGRFDIQLEIGKLRKEDIANYYKLWFKDSIKEEILSKIPDNHFKLSEISMYFKQCKYNKNTYIKLLLENCKVN